jgi:hypothetical protein
VEGVQIQTQLVEMVVRVGAGILLGTAGSGNTPLTSPSQGNDGGSGNTGPNSGGGGGGGATDPGGNGTGTTGGNGGNGTHLLFLDQPHLMQVVVVVEHIRRHSWTWWYRRGW